MKVRITIEYTEQDDNNYKQHFQSEFYNLKDIRKWVLEMLNGLTRLFNYQKK